MKKLNLLKYLPALFMLFLFACEGPSGPVGQDGEDGLDGLEGFVFEYNVDFIAPDYAAFMELPDDFAMLDSDVMMVYLLWEITDDGTEVWRALPQTKYFTDGILSYNFDFTKYDASVFLEGTVDLDGLGADWTDAWIARVVVLPAQFVNARTTLDYTNYDQVKEYFKLSPTQLNTANYPKRPSL